MADELVKLLNAYGYQPVFLPRTNVEPPELYNFVDKRLIRRGPLKYVLPAVERMRPTRGAVADIEHKQTSGKNARSAVAFLGNALSALGISAVPKLDLSFAGSKEFVFSFSEVSYSAVDPARLDQVLQQLRTYDSIPDEYVRSGRLHIAYEYLYAKRLLLRRADHKSFSIDISGSVGDYIDVGLSGNVETDGTTVVTFAPSGPELPAFAFKVGRLEWLSNRWIFQPEVVMRGAAGRRGARKPYIPARSVVLLVEDAEKTPDVRRGPRGLVDPVHTPGNRAAGVLEADLQSHTAKPRMRGGSSATARKSPVTPDMLKALQPHIINLRQGQFSTGGKFASSREQVDAILMSLRTWAAKSSGPIMLYAHGGLVPEDEALRKAFQYHRWWLDNGVYPVYFVWETGILETIGQFLSGAMFRARVQKRMRDVWDWTTDPIVEAAARAAGGGFLWGGMKRGAELAGSDDSGAAYFLHGLNDICRGLPTREIHAMGHSAGSIFHSYVLPLARKLGVPSLKSLHLLAPAIKTTLFKNQILPLWNDGWVENIAVFTMREKLEKADNCMGLYRKSLLYLIFHALELLPRTSIVGLQECITRDKDLAATFGLSGPPDPRAEVIWSESNAGPRSSSESHTHGGFDDDPSTMESVLRRILSKADSEPIVPFPMIAKAIAASGMT